MTSSKKIIRRIGLIGGSTLVAVALLAGNLTAQTFSSGSDGSFGAIDVTSGSMAIDLPPDGIIHATSVNIAFGATLFFNRNELNTPVYLLATEEMTLGGTISVDGSSSTTTANGLGGPGGFDGGAPDSGGGTGGHGLGPGGGGPGDDSGTETGASGGVYAGLPTEQTDQTAEVYGNSLLVPLIGGSGGGGSPTQGGGGGGGAILVSSDVAITFSSGSSVRARGGGDPFSNASSQGSGGAIHLVAPRITGVTTLDVSGGSESSTSDRGGHGRIRVDSLDLRTFNATYTPGNAATTGSVLVTMPTLPQLSLVNVAGTDIAEGATSNATVILPSGSSATQPVTVRARDFGTVVPVRLVVTPQNGAQIIIDDTIDNTSTNPADKVININVPTDELLDIAVWTGQ